MNVLFIHNNFPGQFKHLVNHYLQDVRNQVVAIGRDTAPIFTLNPNPRLRAFAYKMPRDITPKMHHYLHDMERAVLSGQAVAKILLALKEKGFVPDVTFAHIGWGEALYFKEVFPNQPLVGYAEFYYSPDGVDVGFDPSYGKPTLDDRLRVRTRNAHHLLSLVDCDALVSPTEWQKALFPKEFTTQISVIHEGIDTSNISPDAEATFTLPDGTVLKKSDEVITYTSRNLEHYRGFHVFMKVIEEVCKRRPHCHVLITGGDEVSYGKKPPPGKTFREMMLEQVEVDLQRVHFLGRIPYETHLKMLQVSSAHIYLTYPFVLSWSFLEAMASECVLIASDTAPVLEMLQHGRNGLLCNFFDHQQIANLVDEVFASPDRMRSLGQHARKDILAHYDLTQSLCRYDSLVKRLLS